MNIFLHISAACKMYDNKFAIILSDFKNVSSVYDVTSSPPAGYHQRGSYNPLCRHSCYAGYNGEIRVSLVTYIKYRP